MALRWTSVAVLCGAMLASAGCPYVGSKAYNDEIRDFDGDGVLGERFGGEDCRDDDPEVLRCDGDGDGFDAVSLGGTDCNDGDATIHPQAQERCNGIDDDCDELVDDDDPDPKPNTRTWHADTDNDGFGAVDNALATCVRPDGYTADDRDCDDSRDDIHPGAPEFCDDLDRDCTGDPRDAVDQVDFFPDEDGDGFGRPIVAGEAVVKSCGDLPGLANNSDDCDDTDASVFPGAADAWYDGVDSNCDGASDYDQDGDGQNAVAGGGVDCDDTDAAVNRNAVEVCDNGIDNDCDGLADDDDRNEDPVDPTGQLSYFLDGDGDLYGGIEQKFCVDKAPAGWILQGGDCDDQRSDIVPSATEVCDDTDNDCNGVIDDNAVDALDYFADGDGDGYGSTVVRACGLEAGLAGIDGDCDDSDPATRPGAPEICGDSVRQDCSSLSIYDCDSDGFEDQANGGTDCDDTRDDVFPGGTEVCDGHDNDCDGDFDGDDSDITTADLKTWYVDDDDDGFGTTVTVLVGACTPPPGTSDNSDDCDDTAGTVFPGAPERCDGVANDCNAPSSVDIDPVEGIPTYHRDNDDDGFGSASVVWNQTCLPPSTGTWTLDASDCNDGNDQVHPNADEVCDGIDNDCDGQLDGDDPGLTPPDWFGDSDGDGWGLATDVVGSCTQPIGYVATSGDCDDTDASSNPAAPEVCDGGADNDCDGLIDDADPSVTSTVVWYADADNDGFGDANQVTSQCDPPVNHVANDQDCDDGVLAVNPGALETCDGLDNDCDGLVDDADTSLADAGVWYADTDGDNFGSFDVWVRTCARPAGHLPQSGDCDDAAAGVHPGAPELCDGIDNDCDEAIDDADSGAQGTDWFEDADFDGHGRPGAALAACTNPGAGWSATDDDCDDSEASTHPGADETCNSADDDCDGFVDDQDPSVTDANTYWIDVDGDGQGNPNFPLVRCSLPSGYVPNADDCLDIDANANLGAPEVCDGVDNDCDGLTDDDDTGVSGQRTFWADLDNDGWGDDSSSLTACFHPDDYIEQPGDCDDSSDQVAPFMFEECDGIDNNCDGNIDEGQQQQVWVDADGDGWGAQGTLPTIGCPGNGYSYNDQDCDDTAALINPDQTTDVPGDGIDNNCDWVDGIDADFDGWPDGIDCDDNDAGIFPGEAGCPWPQSCAQWRAASGGDFDGMYTVDPLIDFNPINVYCDMHTDGGGWSLVLKVNEANDWVSTSNYGNLWHPDLNRSDFDMAREPGPDGAASLDPQLVRRMFTDGSQHLRFSFYDDGYSFNDPAEDAYADYSSGTDPGLFVKGSAGVRSVLGTDYSWNILSHERAGTYTFSGGEVCWGDQQGSAWRQYEHGLHMGKYHATIPCHIDNDVNDVMFKSHYANFEGTAFAGAGHCGPGTFQYDVLGRCNPVVAPNDAIYVWVR